MDGIFIGNRLGRDAMAAAAVSVPFVEILIALSMAVASGAGVMISGQLGRGEKEKALQTFHAAIVLPAVATFYALLANIWGFPYADQIVATINALPYFWALSCASPQRSTIRISAAYSNNL